MANFVEQELEEVLAAARAEASSGGDPAAKLGEADELIAQLRIDARGGAAKAALAAKAEEVAALRNRGALLGGAASAAPSAAAARARLDGARNKTEEATLRIDTTRELVEEIQQTGEDILEELGRNKETIGNINGHLASTKADLKRSEKITTRMSKWWNRW